MKYYRQACDGKMFSKEPRGAQHIHILSSERLPDFHIRFQRETFPSPQQTCSQEQVVEEEEDKKRGNSADLRASSP